MGLSRQFLNLIVDNRIPGAKSLRYIDLTRHKLFNTTIPVALPLMNGNKSESGGAQAATPWPDNGKKNMKTIRLPAPSINFRASAMRYNWWMYCFPLAGRKLLCADQSGRTILFDADTREAEYVPYLKKPKCFPLAISVVPSANAGDGGDGGRIYIMESSPNQKLGDATQLNHQFEAFVYCRPTLTWHRQILPPPPFICNPKYYVSNSTRPKISSYAVVGGGSHVCISVDDAGTYCLDTVTHTWTQVGEWTLPFVGKVEYVPELKLWFGICAKDLQLGAADLSNMDMDSPPQLLGTWKELEAPQDWTEFQHPQLVNLGSGRFCIARFFQALNLMTVFDDSDDPIVEFFTVLTGTDVVPCAHECNGTANATCSNGNGNGSNGKAKLQMISHNSRRHMSYGSDGNIKVVF